MIVVDTSVWVEALRGKQSRISAGLRQLLDEDQVALAIPVRIDLLSGASRQDGQRLRRTLSALPLLVPGVVTWSLIETWAIDAALKGDRFGVGDLLVAGLAAEVEAAVWSLDGDFARMERRGWIQCWQPPG